MPLLDEVTKIIMSKEYGDQPDKYGLTKKELVMLQLINALSPKNDHDGSFAVSLTSNQVDLLNNFMENIMGDMKFNKRLRKIKFHPDFRNLVSQDEKNSLLSPAKALAAFTFKTRRIKQYDAIANKFIRNAYEEHIIHKKKISLGEYGIL